MIFQFGRQQKAGKSRLTVQQHRACAAFADLASVLGAGKPEVFPQDFQQGSRLIRCDLAFLTVDREFQ